MILEFNRKFNTRKEISALLGGDTQKGIAKSAQVPVLLLFTNEDELYTDYFYPRGTYKYCMYTGIGRKGHQDSIENNMYDLNMDVLTHKASNRKLLVFEKRNAAYHFIGEYQLIETHQNVQPDEDENLRRVFVFHLEKVADRYELTL